MKKDILGKRVFMTIWGTIGTAIGCGFLKFADLGMDPFNAMVTGIANLGGMQHGIAFTLVTAIFLIFTLIFDKRYIGVTTLVMLFLFGYVLQYTLVLLNIFFPSADIFLRIITLSFGLLLISAASSLYFTADMGVSAYDAASLIAADKSPLPFRVCRIITDVTCVILGFSFNATIGIGTIITAFFLGLAIDFFNKQLAEPFLYGRLMMKSKKKISF